MKHFGDISQLNAREFFGLLKLARELQDQLARTGRNEPLLAGQTLAMVFMKSSLRTRVSFEMGMRHLGGHAAYLSPDEVGLGTRESAPDIARVLSGMVEGLMARVFSHHHIEELMAFSDIPVINGLSDASHPCQALADTYTIQRQLGAVQGVRLAYIGDGDSNMCRSLAEASQLAGMEMTVVAPAGYQLTPDFLEAHAPTVQVTPDLDGVKGADVLYTDVWVSMGQEADSQVRLRDLEAYQVNERLLDHVGNRDVIVLHCLPAHRGEEITDGIMDGAHSRVFPQAHNRLHAQKAILAHLLGGVPLPA